MASIPPDALSIARTRTHLHEPSMTFCPAARSGRVSWFRHPAAVLALWLLSAVAAHAAPPAVTTMVRKGAAPGESFKMTVGGSGLAGDVRLWTSFSDPMPLADAPPDNGKTDGYCTFAVKVPAGTPLGIHSMRVLSPNGIGPAMPFLIDDLPTVEKAASVRSRSCRTIL